MLAIAKMGNFQIFDITSRENVNDILAKAAEIVESNPGNFKVTISLETIDGVGKIEAEQ